MMVSIHKWQCMMTLSNPPIIFLYVWLKRNVALAGQVCTKISHIFEQNAPQTFLFGMVQMQNFVFLGAPASIQCIRTCLTLLSLFHMCGRREMQIWLWVGMHSNQSYFGPKCTTNILVWNGSNVELCFLWVHQPPYGVLGPCINLLSLFYMCG